MSRRWICALVLAALASACSPATPGDAAPTQPPVPAPTSPRAPDESAVPDAAGPSVEPTPAVEPAPPPPVPPIPEPADGEVYPNAKRLASAVAHALTNYDADTTPEEVFGAVTDDREQWADLADASRPLRPASAWSRGTVVYPQLGGVRGERASVMVVVRQLLGGRTDTAQTVTRTLDVRLRTRDGVWVFDQLASVGGSPPAARPEPTPAAEAILDDPRIALPDSARWDIESGDITPSLLALMDAMAEQAAYDVVVLASGHPRTVFGTDRLSNHTRGRAVDLYRLDGERIIDLRDDGSPARALVEWLYARPEVANIGSPWALDGFGGRSFTDVVHQDHIHVAVRAEDR